MADVAHTHVQNLPYFNPGWDWMSSHQTFQPSPTSPKKHSAS